MDSKTKDTLIKVLESYQHLVDTFVDIIAEEHGHPDPESFCTIERLRQSCRDMIAILSATEFYV